jgi:hypothetical protein
MSEHDEESGRRAVRALLIEPLEEDGMRRHQRTTVEAHKAFTDRLAEKLAYMRPENLRALKPIVASLASGPALNVWPEFQTITQHAYRIQPPPDQSDDILWSWLHSIEGPRCRQAGTLYATRLYIKAMRRPPVEDYTKKRVAERQREVDRDMENLRRLRGLGQATDSQVEAILAHDRIVADCEAIVDAGIRHREERGVAA